MQRVSNLAAALGAGGIAALLARLAAHGLGGSGGIAWTCSAVGFAVGAWLGLRAWTRVAQRPERGLLLALGLVAAGAWSGVALFVDDVSETRFVLHGPNAFTVKHSCLSACAVALHHARAGSPNLYDEGLYAETEEPCAVHDEIGGRLTIDSYPYPPPLLVLPWLLDRFGSGFFDLRRLWFLVVGGAWAAGVFVASRWVGSRAVTVGSFALLLAPTALATLQIGNVHPLVLAACVGAGIAFDARRPASGGILLGFAVIAKLWPAALLVPLALARRWRAVLWTVVAAAVGSVVAWLVFGPAPFQAFFEVQLPRLASGEAFPFLAETRPVTLNLSVQGVPHKLHALGLGPEPPLQSPWIRAGWMLFLVALLVRARSRPASLVDARGERLERLQVWLAWIGLFQLSSPFLPWAYATLATLWLLVLLAGSVRRPSALVVLGAACVALAVNVPLPFGSEGMQRLYTLLATVLTVGLCACVVSRRIRTPHASAPEPG